MWYAARRLALGLFLIALTSAILLLSDREHRTSARIKRVAVLQHASTTLLDEGVAGMVEGLAARGFVEGRNLKLTRFNAQGDMSTGVAIARQVTTGDYDLVLTSSTPSMQAVANVNREGKTIHVFGIVADPFSAGIGLDRAHPMQHPKYMVGQSTFLPVVEVFQMARQFFPGLTTVGVGWNPAESNSEAFTKKAREACVALGLTLLEANVDNSSAVGEAVNSLIARGAQALWIGGDNTMLSALDTAVATARRGRIPVFSITPGKPDRGTLFDVGLDFRVVGRLTGELAAEVLSGTDPGTIPIRDVQDRVPRLVIVNTLRLRDLRDPWQIPEQVLRDADTLVDGTGIHRKGSAQAGASGKPRPLSRTWSVDLIEFNNVVDVEEAEKGVLEGLKEAGLVLDRDYRVRIRNAQGDMMTANGLIDAAVTEGADLLITFSTPTLQAAIQRSRGVPVVFNYVANAVWAGAGKSDTDHLPNVTGVQIAGAYDEMFALVRQVLPSARRVGTLYVPSEVNTVYNRDRMVEAAARAQIEYVAVSANTTAEVADAALSLVTQRIDAICQLSGNLTAAAFPSIAQAARRARLPVFVFQTSQLRAGAVAALARDYHDGGRAAALLAARVMRGEHPSTIPFQSLETTRLLVNLAAAREIGLTLPPGLVARADEVIGR